MATYEKVVVEIREIITGRYENRQLIFQNEGDGDRYPYYWNGDVDQLVEIGIVLKAKDKNMVFIYDCRSSEPVLCQVHLTLSGWEVYPLKIGYAYGQTLIGAETEPYKETAELIKKTLTVKWTTFVRLISCE